MRVRLVIEMDAPILGYKDITDRITDAALKVLRRRSGHLIGVYQDAEADPEGRSVQAYSWIECRE